MSIREILKNLKPEILSSEKALGKFYRRELNDKTFSKLFCTYLGLNTFYGVAIHVVNGMKKESYLIGKESSVSKSYGKWIVHYDFRNKFKDLENWLRDRKIRPKPMICEERQLQARIENALKLGSFYSHDFFVIIQELSTNYALITSCAGPNGEVYIECPHFVKSQGVNIAELKPAENPAHGKEQADLIIVFNKEEIFSQSEALKDKELLRYILKKTREISQIIGFGTIVEWLLVENTLYFFSAQCASVKGLHALSHITKLMQNKKKVCTISPGKTEGIVRQVSFPIDNIYLKKGEKYIFSAPNPSSGLCALIPYAKGFIFEKANILCHLAILLREQKIPAMVMKDVRNPCDGEKIFFDAEKGFIRPVGSYV